MSGALTDQAAALLVQRDQLDRAGGGLARMVEALDNLAERQRQSQQDLDDLCSLAERLLVDGTAEAGDAFPALEAASVVDTVEVTVRTMPLPTLDFIDGAPEDDWATHLAKVRAYAARNALALPDDPFATLLSPTQRVALEKRIRDDFTLRTARCDTLDYMIAGTCGFIGGMVDVLLVGTPGTGYLTTLTDEAMDKAVQSFAGLCGWDGPREGSDPVASAIGFLERMFKINYDQSHSGDVGHLFKMSTKNHHVKSLGHSPDLVGLFFSTLDQFTNTAHFVADGKLVSIDTSDKDFRLQGHSFTAKVYAGFINWFGHLMSDAAGSSGGRGSEGGGRGSGIPIPFFSLLQFIDIGEFGRHRQTFATVAVKVFEGGYDFRHGMALAVPVLLTELLVRVMWTFKRRFRHGLPWQGCLPTAGNPELRRMLLVGHGTLCLVDGADAALRSGGDMVTFMLRANLLGWARLGTLALREMKAWYQAGGLDDAAVDAYLDAEYRRLLAA